MGRDCCIFRALLNLRRLVGQQGCGRFSREFTLVLVVVADTLNVIRVERDRHAQAITRLGKIPPSPSPRLRSRRHFKRRHRLETVQTAHFRELWPPAQLRSSRASGVLATRRPLRSHVAGLSGTDIVRETSTITLIERGGGITEGPTSTLLPTVFPKTCRLNSKLYPPRQCRNKSRENTNKTILTTGTEINIFHHRKPVNKHFWQSPPSFLSSSTATCLGRGGVLHNLLNYYLRLNT